MKGLNHMAETIVRQGTTRCERGIALYWQHRDHIERTGPSSYLVPSCSSNERYSVELSLGYCSCPDRERAKLLNVSCKHVVAATIHHAKSKR